MLIQDKIFALWAEIKLSGGLYHELQVRMTYNSNHIAEEELTEEIVKQFHYIIKHDTKDSMLSWFAVGDYKKRANVVGGRETSKPSEVSRNMKALLEKHNNKENVNIEDIIELHAEFEYIHPFQDANGRVGRLIALKECLKNNIIPKTY